MTRAALLLFAVLCAVPVGFLAGRGARRAREQAALPPRRVRPTGIEARMRAFEERGEAASTPAPAPAPAPVDLDPESAADLAWLAAAAAGDEAALLALARRHDGTDAAARALWTLVERARDPVTKEGRRQAFAARHPDAWVLATGRRRSP